jgi:hypothetical protein
VFLFLAVLLPASVASAQEWREFARYRAVIGVDDLFNSRGVQLFDPAAVIQQDRANFHRFGLRQRGDQGDPFFGDRSARARIPGLVDFLVAPSFVASVRSGQTAEVDVYICGRNDIELIAVADPWGETAGCF